MHLTCAKIRFIHKICRIFEAGPTPPIHLPGGLFAGSGWQHRFLYVQLSFDTSTCRIYFKLRTKLRKNAIQKENFWNRSKSILGSSSVKKMLCPRSICSVSKREGGSGITCKYFVPQDLKDQEEHVSGKPAVKQ